MCTAHKPQQWWEALAHHASHVQHLLPDTQASPVDHMVHMECMQLKKSASAVIHLEAPLYQPCNYLCWEASWASLPGYAWGLQQTETHWVSHCTSASARTGSTCFPESPGSVSVMVDNCVKILVEVPHNVSTAWIVICHPLIVGGCLSLSNLYCAIQWAADSDNSLCFVLLFIAYCIFWCSLCSTDQLFEQSNSWPF